MSACSSAGEASSFTHCMGAHAATPSTQAIEAAAAGRRMAEAWTATIAAMFTVYGMSDSGNCYKVRLALEQLALPYRWVEVDTRRGETRTAEFLARNPNGQVPTLVLDDGTVLPESNAMLVYLADGSPLLPEGRLERARALQWMFFEQYSHEPCIAVARAILRYQAPG